MNTVDKIVSFFSPEAGLKRVQARKQLKITNDYEALRPSKFRKIGRSLGDADALSARSQLSLMQMSRHLDENSDLVVSVIESLVNNVVGEKGIQIEPMPLKKDGSVDADLAKQIKSCLHKYNRCADIHFNQMPETQRLVARSLFRDGEIFVQNLKNKVPGLIYKNDLLFVQELIESQHVPNYGDERNNVVCGIQRNQFGQVIAYGFDAARNQSGVSSFINVEFKPAKDILHVKLARRVGQLRGIPILASVMTRIQDLNDYENAEQVAAKMAACMVAVIKKETPDGFDPESLKDPDYVKALDERTFTMKEGQVWDQLRPGESVEILQSNRPNPLGVPFRNQMVKAIAAGTCTSYSTISRNYDGNYSAQRQELIDQWQNYKVFQNILASQYLQPTYIDFVEHLLATNQIKVGPQTDKNMIDNATYIAPVMPWIDPAKETRAYGDAIALKIVPREDVIRRSGGIPDEVNAKILKDIEFMSQFPNQNPTFNSGEILKDDET